MYNGIPIFQTSKGNENWFEKSRVRKIEGGTQSRLIYEVLFCIKWESKQKYHGTLVKFLAFIWSLLKTQKLEAPYTHDKQHQQESHK